MAPRETLYDVGSFGVFHGATKGDVESRKTPEITTDPQNRRANLLIRETIQSNYRHRHRCHVLHYRSEGVGRDRGKEAESDGDNRHDEVSDEKRSRLGEGREFWTQRRRRYELDPEQQSRQEECRQHQTHMQIRSSHDRIEETGQHPEHHHGVEEDDAHGGRQ